MSHFVDTNIFIRFLTGDDTTKSDRCLGLFEAAERGEIRLVTSESIVAEIVYVLSSPTYRFSRDQITRAVRVVLENRGLTIEHKQMMLDSLDLYGQTNLDFEDCLSVNHIRRAALDGIYSYDRGFDRVREVQRFEP